MARAITFVDETDNTVYTLEYTRSAVRTLERLGFTNDRVNKYPFTYYPLLFRTAFQPHHADLHREKLDELWEAAPNKSGMVNILCEMVYDTVNTMYKPEQIDEYIPTAQKGAEQAGSPSFTGLFYKMLPFFLSIGMTPEQFWDGDCTLTRAYIEAHELRMNLENQRLWMQGAYFYHALCDVAPVMNAFAKSGTKPTPYLAEPFPLTNAEAQTRKEEKRVRTFNSGMAKMKAWMEQTNQKREKLIGGCAKIEA